MSYLPFELYRPIIEDLCDRKSLLQLCRVSPAFRYEAERILYHHPNIYFRHPNAQALLLRQITLNERQALIVYRLYLTFYIPYGTDDEEMVWWEICAPLQALVHLKHLVLNIEPTTGSTHYLGTTRGCIFKDCLFQLRSLVCPFDCDEDMIIFLWSQSELVHIERNPPHVAHSYIDPHFTSSPDFLPNVSRLSGFPMLVGAFFSAGRRITHLQIHGSDFLDNLPYLEHVEVLSLWGVPALTSSRIAASLPRVRCLECLVGSYVEELGLALCISALPLIETVKLHCSYHDMHYRDPEMLGLVQKLFNRSISLSLVIVELATGPISVGKSAVGIGNKVTLQGWSFTRGSGKFEGKRCDIGWNTWTFLD